MRSRSEWFQHQLQSTGPPPEWQLRHLMSLISLITDIFLIWGYFKGWGDAWSHQDLIFFRIWEKNSSKISELSFICEGNKCVMPLVNSQKNNWSLPKSENSVLMFSPSWRWKVGRSIVVLKNWSRCRLLTLSQVYGSPQIPNWLKNTSFTPFFKP